MEEQYVSFETAKMLKEAKVIKNKIDTIEFEVI